MKMLYSQIINNSRLSNQIKYKNVIAVLAPNDQSPWKRILEHGVTHQPLSNNGLLNAGTRRHFETISRRYCILVATNWHMTAISETHGNFQVFTSFFLTSNIQIILRNWRTVIYTNTFSMYTLMTRKAMLQRQNVYQYQMATCFQLICTAELMIPVKVTKHWHSCTVYNYNKTDHLQTIEWKLAAY